MAFEEEINGVAARICEWMLKKRYIGGKNPAYLPAQDVLRFSLRPAGRGIGNNAIKWLLKLGYMGKYGKAGQDLVYLNSQKMGEIIKFIEKNIGFY